MDKEKIEIMQKTAKRIKYLRTIRGLSQESLALSAGLNPAYLGHIERCLKCPTIDTLNKIALALDVPLSELVRFDSEPEISVCNEAIERIAFSIRGLSENDAQQVAEIVAEIVKLKLGESTK
jgi:transcriptional regulator with XRE-family HTH domain